MSFLNGALVLGTLAALAPLIIHLFNRSRFKVIKWGATHLLESVLRKNRKQIQLEQWIILIIRCSIPIILALTLARMVVMNWNSFLFFLILPIAALLFLIFLAFSSTTRWLWGILSAACVIGVILGAIGFLPEWGKNKEISSLSGEVPASTVILLDDSLSMNTNDGFSKAQSFISGFLKNMNQQSETTIIQLGGMPSPLFEKPTADPLALDLGVSNLNALGDQASVLASLDQALSIVSEGKNLKREIILLSDFRNSDWMEWDRSAIDSFRERLGASPNAPELTWVDFGLEAKKNLLVEKIVLSSQTVGVGHPVRVRATIRNLSDESFEGNLRVILTADQNESTIDEAALSIGPQATAQVAFSHHFDLAGPKVLHVELMIADDLPQDNRRSVAISVIEQIDVLIIDGDPSREWLRGESDFLKLALTPFIENKHKEDKDLEMKDLIKATTIPIEQFKKAEQFGEARLIVLANVKELESTITEEIESFVVNGGGLLICSGNQVNSGWYNENLGATGSGLLPMPILGEKGNLQNELTYKKFNSSYFEHPALSMFNDPRNGSLSEGLIKKWLDLDEVKSRSDPTVTVVARLENGDPIMSEKKVGKGVVMFWASSIDTDWNNLPTRPSFLPFTQQITTYLSEKVLPPQTVRAGYPLTYYLSEDGAQLEYELTIPNDSSRKLIPRKRKDKYLLEFTDTRLPGTYVLSNNEQVIAKFVVLASPSESNLEKAKKDTINEISKELAENVNQIDGRNGEGWNAYLTMDSHRKFGRETWKIMLAVVLGLILMEIILLRKFGKIVR